MKDEFVKDGDKTRLVCRYDEAIVMEHAQAVRTFGNGFSSCRDVRELASIPLPEFLRMQQANQSDGCGPKELNERILRWVIRNKREFLTVPRLDVGNIIRPKREV